MSSRWKITSPRITCFDPSTGLSTSAASAGFYSHTGRPSVDPELMIRMLRVGYSFGIRPAARLARGSQDRAAYPGYPLPGRRLRSNLPRGDKAGRNDGAWTRADFEWDAENNQHICTERHALKQVRRNYSDPNRGPTGKGTARYRAVKEVCQACLSKAKCCPNADARKIPREETEDARQLARDIAKTRQYDISMKLRKRVEMLIAHLKRILGLGRLRLRGPSRDHGCATPLPGNACGANDVHFGLSRPHWGHGWGHGPGSLLLAATAQNLRKPAKILPAPQQPRKA